MCDKINLQLYLSLMLVQYKLTYQCFVDVRVGTEKHMICFSFYVFTTEQIKQIVELGFRPKYVLWLRVHYINQ